MNSSFKPKFLKPVDSDLDKPDTRAGDDITTFTYNPHHNLSIASQRDKLPVRESRDHLLYLLDEHQTVVVVGETGSGKSTQIPQEKGAAPFFLNI